MEIEPEWFNVIQINQLVISQSEWQRLILMKQINKMDCLQGMKVRGNINQVMGIGNRLSIIYLIY